MGENYRQQNRHGPCYAITDRWEPLSLKPNLLGPCYAKAAIPIQICKRQMEMASGKW